MKINKTDMVLKVYNNMGHKPVDENKNRIGKDKIEFSKSAREYQFAINKLKETPEMRMEKVNKLKEEIKSGNYKVEGKKIVEKIYENVNFDKRI
jgi:negative regulator of flagellin synthesis FlgM